VVGNEADGVDPHAPHPDHLEVIAAGVLRGGHGPVLVSTTYVTAPGGAAIFAAGTTDWACALEPPCPGGIAPPATVDAVRAITRNVVLGLAEPYAGLRHPVQPWPVPTARQYLQTRQHPATGTYGSATEAEPAASDPPNHQP